MLKKGKDEITKQRRGQTIVLDKAEVKDDRSRLLVVEDEDQLRNLLQEVLDTEGYNVHTAASADAALPMINDQTYDLIISDVMMPGLSGMNFLVQAKKISPSTEFIIMTGFPKVSAAVAAIKAGAFDYISKPFDISEIKEKVKGALQHARVNKTKEMNKTDALGKQNTRKLAGFNIIRTLGEGSMGVVFLVERIVNNETKRFAMKIIRTDEINGKTDTTERFFKEAEASGNLQHPHIIQVLEHGYAREENIPYLIMEYFDGETLHRKMEKKEAGDLETKVKLIIQIAEALDAAHSAGIVHRDIKPDNIMISKSFHAKLTDFGVAQLPGSMQTDTMKMIGTPFYLAPEAFNSPKVNAQADIYSLGTVAYELFLGVRPFEVDVISLLGYKVQTENPPEPLSLKKDFPFNLQPILEKMLKKDPKERYKRASEVARSLRKVLVEGFTHKKVFSKSKWNTL